MALLAPLVNRTRNKIPGARFQTSAGEGAATGSRGGGFEDFGTVARRVVAELTPPDTRLSQKEGVAGECRIFWAIQAGEGTVQEESRGIVRQFGCERCGTEPHVIPLFVGSNFDMEAAARCLADALGEAVTFAPSSILSILGYRAEPQIVPPIVPRITVDVVDNDALGRAPEEFVVDENDMQSSIDPEITAGPARPIFSVSASVPIEGCQQLVIRVIADNLISLGSGDAPHALLPRQSSSFVGITSAITRKASLDA